MLAVFLNQTLLWYLPKNNLLKNRTSVEVDPGPPANSEDGAIYNNSTRLKAVY